MPLEIRLINVSEYNAVNVFFNKARNINRPAQKTTRKYNEFCWEFMNGPNGKAIYAAAWDVDDGKDPAIVGIQCVIPFKMISSDGKCVLTAKGEDTLIDITALIKYRKTDILRELYNLLFEECRKKGIEHVWGFNNMYATNKRMGFELPVKSFYGVLVLKPANAFRNIIRQKHLSTFPAKVRIAFLSTLSFIYSLKKNIIFSQKKNYHFNFEMNENVDLFQRATIHDRLFFLLQDSEYIKWRILENPYPVKYRSFQILDRENILQAQVICSINSNEAFIEQTLFDKNLTKKIINYLLKKVILSLKNEDVCLVRYIGFKNNILNKREMSLLKNIGYKKRGTSEFCKFVG
jgi:hypothetical protein